MPILKGDQIVHHVIRILDEVHNEIKLRVNNKRDDSAFVRQYDEDRKKQAITIDITAESSFKEKLSLAIPNVIVVGEESMDSFEQISDDIAYVVCDIIDGTDLLEMDIPIWCSAVCVFTATDIDDAKMLCSVVKMANGETYYTYDNETSAYVKTANSEVCRLRGPSTSLNLADCTVSFYGQKISSLLTTLDNKGFRHLLDYLNKSTNRNNLRIQTIAGNPAMVLLADRESDKRRGFDVVLSLRDQKPHDVVPGALIALRSGACMYDIEGNIMTEHELIQALANPTIGIKYIIAANDTIGRQVVALLKGNYLDNKGKN
jgi:fructose-1,6-bisphosphatase/inositol monophosphatase family enzyme